MSEKTKETTFAKGEIVIFEPANGNGTEVEVIDGPLPGTTKYRVAFPDKTVYPVQACYLKSKNR